MSMDHHSWHRTGFGSIEGYKWRAMTIFKRQSTPIRTNLSKNQFFGINGTDFGASQTPGKMRFGFGSNDESNSNNWKAQFGSKEWANTLEFYLDLLNNYGPPGASSNGFNENLALFQTGKCGMWIDATVAGAFVTNKDDSEVADKVGFALAPDNNLGKRGNWLWAWSLAIPAGTKQADAAQKFVSWATSKDYLQLVASKKGWAKVPPGTRQSLYDNEKYMSAAPFAQVTLDSINSADPKNPTVESVPYVGVQFVAIPEFQGIGTAVGQQFSAALAGNISAKQALKNAQRITERTMRKAGYPK